MSKTKILAGETSDGLDLKLQDVCTAESAKKLRAKDEKMAHDCNIIRHAKENGTAFITKDKGSGKACGPNGIKRIWLSDDPVSDVAILPELEKPGPWPSFYLKPPWESHG